MWCVVENKYLALRVSILTLLTSSQRVPIVVVGTKLDLVNEREVHRSTIQNLASQWHLPFYETSAKRNWHATEVFEELLRQMRICYPPPRMKKKRASICVVM
jgi:putative ribosome biogenesis GTPase RsgA